MDGTITPHGLADINSQDIDRVEVVKDQQAGHHLVAGQLLDQLLLALLLEHSQHPFQALTVEREESLDGSHRTPLGVPLGERLQLLDKPLRFREAALDFLIQGHRILRRAAPRTSASA